MQKLRVNMVSESEFTVQGHGVHTAFRELTDELQTRNDVELTVNKSNKGADITHIQTVGLYSAWKLITGKSKKVVSVHVIPESFVGSIVGATYWLPLARLYLKWFYSRADLLFAVSNTVAHELQATMHIKKPIEVFYNTVSMKSYAGTKDMKASARRSLSIKPKEWVVVGNGQVQPRKRLDTFFETAMLCPDVTFIWIGGIPFKQLGAEYGKMNSLMEQTPPNVRMTGIIDHEKVRTYLHAADVFFLPAEQENHPMCVLEAAGAQLPIVLRDIPEYDDTFKDDALLISHASEAAEHIVSLRDNPSFMEKSKVATLRIAKRFDSKAGAEIAVAKYRELITK